MSAQHRYRTWYATAAVLVVLGAAVFALTRPMRDDVLPSVSVSSVGFSVDAGARSDVGVGPNGVVEGVPVGWEHSTEGARAAGEAYVTATADVIDAGPLTRRDVIAGFTTPEYTAELLATTEDVLNAAASDLGDSTGSDLEVHWVEWPLTSIAVADGADVAVVKVWSVAVITAGDGAMPYQLWRTSTLDLRWRDGDWKVASWGNFIGPLPAPLSAQEVSAAEDTNKVLEWRHLTGGPA